MFSCWQWHAEQQYHMAVSTHIPSHPAQVPLLQWAFPVSLPVCLWVFSVVVTTAAQSSASWTGCSHTRGLTRPWTTWLARDGLSTSELDLLAKVWRPRLFTFWLSTDTHQSHRLEFVLLSATRAPACLLFFVYSSCRLIPATHVPSTARVWDKARE